jgi:hypothetical protein
MTDPKPDLPPGWDAQLARDLAELLDAAAMLADGGTMEELPDGFAAALGEAAPDRGTP